MTCFFLQYELSEIAKIKPFNNLDYFNFYLQEEIRVYDFDLLFLFYSNF